jgi:polysaccharide biosynthesis protein PelA
MKLSHLFFALVIGLFWMTGPSGPARAIEIEFNGGPVKRDIIAIYDSRHEKSPQTTRLHQFAEMPINWLGWSLTYIDVNGPLPPLTQLAKYRGIVSWLIEPLDDPERYANWLDAATGAGLRLAFLSELVPPEPVGLEPVIAKILTRVGLASTKNFATVTHRAKIQVLDAEMVGFERPVDKALREFRIYHALDARTRVHLSASVPGPSATTPAVIVATSEGGGYASDEYTIVFDANTDRVRWTLNPFHFFKLALGPERMPVPDVTTLSGRRIYFSHIDGDGWNNVSLIEGYRETATLSAEVIRKDAIEAYPDLPVSVGLIAGDVRPEIGGNAGGIAIARKIFALPQVEVASHTHTHPFNWSFFDAYSRSNEEAMVEKVKRPNLQTFERIRRSLYSIAGQQVPIDQSGLYVAGSSDLPRTYLREPFDLSREVNGALRMSQSLAPPGKMAKIYLWSGDCLPFEGAIAATRAAGVRNMNGGDSRLDAEFPSVFYVPPISKPVGKERQIYSGNSNENTYTNDWTGPYYGFSLLSETIKNTEMPRRLKPFNIYYHMYSGERTSALVALRQNLDLARSQSIAPIAASHYAAIADDFFPLTMAQTDANMWTIMGRGALQTVRFDEADSLTIDPARSRGVLGATRHQSGAMYVALDADVEPAVVALTSRQLAADSPTDVPQLVSARWLFRGYKPDGCGFGITAQGYGPGDMIWQTKANQRYTVTATRDGTVLGTSKVTADTAGMLQVMLNVSAIDPLQLKFSCDE